MKILSKTLISVTLIVIGAVCVAITFGNELVNFPWMIMYNEDFNDVTLSDPPVPCFQFIDYRTLNESERQEVLYAPEPAVLPEELPEPQSEDESSASYYDLPGSFVLLGSAKLPRINISENLFEGVDAQLDYGIGHVPGTAMPGEEGNCSIAGHRVSPGGMYPFRFLDQMKNGDYVTVSLGDEIFTYEVFDIFVVTKYDVWVLEPLPEETHVLTMITCDPLISPVSRVNRLIVRARLVPDTD